MNAVEMIQIEDIITIMNGVSDIVDKILQAPASVKKYLQESFKEMLESQDFHESIYAHLPERQFQEEKGNSWSIKCKSWFKEMNFGTCHPSKNPASSVCYGNHPTVEGDFVRRHSRFN